MQKTIDLAIWHLKKGHVIAIPTETVYGLACDPRQPQAIEKLFNLKKRPRTQPLAVLLPDQTHLSKWSCDFPPLAQQLATAFWPGPLTLVLPKAEGVSDQITAGKPTIGLRIPDHPLTLALLKQFNHGLPASSANLSQHNSATEITTIQTVFNQQVDYFIDGGSCAIGVESSIVAFDPKVPMPTLLREGAISKEKIETVLKIPIASQQG